MFLGLEENREEVISFPNKQSAIIDFKSIYPLPPLGAAPQQMYGLVGVYKVSRDISTVTIGSFTNSYSTKHIRYFEIDMESGDLEEVDSDAID